MIDKIKEKLNDKIIDFNQRSDTRVYIRIKPKDIKEVADFLFNKLDLRFVTASGFDTFNGFEIVYHFSFDEKGQVISVKTLLEDRQNPKIDSIAPLFKAAEWIEREMHELLGIEFIGHPDLKHLLLPDDWPEGKYPLRKEKQGD